MTRFVVGIDLGTTNSALAFASLDEDAPPTTFSIPQVHAPGETVASERFPSTLYFPLDAERAPGAFALPWGDEDGATAGAFAERRAAEAPGRVVSSSKSWLCHPGVDRRGPILPVDAPPDVARVSPVDAATRLLTHLARAWDATHPDARLADIDVVITVPASFDAVARDLTRDAARDVGLDARLTLLEEPQAAFYAWLADRGDAWRKELVEGDVVLVVDIGGGTTDFSLIAVTADEGNLALERLAVGDHILLGGDNMDLALAWRVKQRLEGEGKSIDDWQLRGLTHSCRAAKEALLSDETRAGHPVVVPGRGSRLIGGTLRAELTRDDVTSTLVDGFFPPVGLDARPAVRLRGALTTMGLPYAHDPAITKHLASFVARHVEAAGPQRAPTAILFNGGVTRASALTRRVVDVVTAWVTAAGRPAPRVLAGADPDRAVARGAAHYARVRQGKGIRIKGGLARGYYVGIERAELAVPGVAPRVDAVCIAPMGMEEGETRALDVELGLVTGEPVSFRVFSSSARPDDAVGATAAPASLDELPPIEARLELAGQGPGVVVPVRLASTVTALGTLELAAHHTASEARWRLEFDVRGES